jgi:hypothetical protein
MLRPRQKTGKPSAAKLALSRTEPSMTIPAMPRNWQASAEQPHSMRYDGAVTI